MNCFRWCLQTDVKWCTENKKIYSEYLGEWPTDTREEYDRRSRYSYLAQRADDEKVVREYVYWWWGAEAFEEYRRIREQGISVHDRGELVKASLKGGEYVANRAGYGASFLYLMVDPECMKFC